MGINDSYALPYLSLQKPLLVMLQGLLSSPSSLPLFEQNYSAHSTADNHISNVSASDSWKAVVINVVYETGIHFSRVLELVLCVEQ